MSTSVIHDENVAARIDELQLRYISALDDRKLDAWLATFAMDDTASYVCTSAENEEAGFRVALMLDDCRARLEDRVTFITKVWAGTFQDYRTRHFVQRAACMHDGENRYAVHTNFHITYASEESGETRVLASGRYVDRVQIADGQAWFLSKKAITDSGALPRYVVYPL